MVGFIGFSGTRLVEGFYACIYSKSGYLVGCHHLAGQRRNKERYGYSAEIDISVSKLLGFETFAKSLRVLVSVSENLVLEKKSRFRF